MNEDEPEPLTALATTSQGDIVLIVDRDPRRSLRPVILMIHGALRNSERLRKWYPILQDRFDLILADLPGHGRSAAEGETDVGSLIARFKELILRHFETREIVVVGESVGGLVALGVGDGSLAQVKGVIAADPPLSTAKQWAIYGNFHRKMREDPLDDFLRKFVFDVFGFTANGVEREHIYYPLIPAVRVPALVLTGDHPLWPTKSQATIPCLLDNVDKWMIRSINNKYIRLRTIAGADHLCLDPPTSDCSRVVIDFCSGLLHCEGIAPLRARVSG